MSYSNYSQYLCHPIFLKTVQVAKDRAGVKCEKCSTETKTEPHHIRYCKWGQFDPPENILMLCRDCHSKEHTCGRCGKVTLKAFHIKNSIKNCCYSHDPLT